MSDIGDLLWIDLTVEDAGTLHAFYARVVGWTPAPVSMGDYNDYNMNAPASGAPIAGVCHARGANAEHPPVWIPYFGVADLEASLAECTALGGEIVVAPRRLGATVYCVIKDPAGAAVALLQAGDDA